MTDSFILCIAVDSPICNSAKQESNTLTFSLLTSNDRSEARSPRASLRSFTLDLAAEWLEFARGAAKKPETTCKGNVLAELFLTAYRELCQMDDAAMPTVKQPQVRTQMVNGGVQPWLEEARNILRREFGDQPKLPEIAAKVGVHPVHLAREFRRHYGLSVGEYLRKIRIEFACDRLLCSEDPPVKIASAAGFVDQSHFSRTFRRLLGTTPGRYRAALKRSCPLEPF